MTTPRVPEAAARLGLGLAFAVGAVLVVLYRAAYRGVETSLAGQIGELVTDGKVLTLPDRSIFVLGIGTPDVVALRITPECSAALITAAVLFLSALLLVVPRFPKRRIVLAASTAVGLFAVLNFARLAFIAFATDSWGRGGFGFSHTWAGTFLTLIGAALAVVAMIVILGTERGGAGRFTRRSAR